MTFSIDALSLALGLFALSLGFACWQAWRIGNEQRDVLALGGAAGVTVVGALAAAAF